jgi:hypothetical protein
MFYGYIKVGNSLKNIDFLFQLQFISVTNFNTTVAVITLLTDAICSAVVHVMVISIYSWRSHHTFENNLSVLCYQKSTIGDFTRPVVIVK